VSKMQWIILSVGSNFMLVISSLVAI